MLNILRNDHSHTHTETLHIHTHTDSAISLSIQFQFLTDFDNLIERGLLFNRLNSRFSILFRPRSVVSCCLSHSFISNSRLSTRLAIRDVLSTWTTRRPLKTKRRYKCRLLGYRSKSKRSSQTIATNSNSNRESGGTAASASGIELEPALELQIKQQLIPCSACGLSHC